MKKKLAVIIPFYNEEESILKVINEWSSVINQNNMDLILINDGSNDNSLNLIKQTKKNFKNLILINKKNGGHGSAIIKGNNFAAKKKYKFIFQTDSDEQFVPKKFYPMMNEKIKYSILILRKAGLKRLIIKIINYLDTRIMLSIFKLCRKKQKI